MLEADLDILIDRIYAAGVEPAKWRDVLEGLRDVCGDGVGVLLKYDVAVRDGSFAVTAYMEDDWRSAYDRHYAARNPWLPNLPKRPIGITVPAEFMLERQELIKTEFYNDFLTPQGLMSGLGVTLLKDSQRFVAFSLLYSERTAEKAKENVALVQRLTPHLIRAFQLNRQLARAEFRWQAAEASLEALTVGVAILDAVGQLSFLNAAANRMIGENDGLSLDRGGCLRATASADEARLRRLIAEVLDLINGKSRRCGGAVAVRRPSGRPAYSLLISPLYPPGSGLHGIERAAVIFINDFSQSTPLSGPDLQNLFGLSAAEARLALHLAGGTGLENAANEVGVAKETARSQLKAIFAKTGVRRQAELASLLTRLALSGFSRNIW